MSAFSTPSPGHAGAATPRAALDAENLPERAAHVRRLGLTGGLVGLGVWLLMALFSPAAYPAYLVAYTYVLGLSVGSLAALLLHHLVGGDWGFVIRRPCEAAVAVLPLMALLFLPILFGAGSLYEWTDPLKVRGSLTVPAVHAIKEKAGYLNIWFWGARAALYFALWVGIATLFRRWSVEQDQTDSPAPTRRRQAFAGPFLVVVFLTVTFAAIDWMMSIEPEWYSTIYGVMVLIGWSLSTLSVTIITATVLRKVRPLEEVATPTGFQELGNLLLAFTMLWAYMSFSQYLIIWSGNLAEEVPWYLKRSIGGWRYLAASLMIFHFFVPFFCLLIRETKRSADRLWRVCVALLVMHFLNDAWLIIPAYPEGQWVSILALAPAAVGVGGLWVASFAHHLTSRPLLPSRHDPLLAEVFAHHGQHGG